MNAKPHSRLLPDRVGRLPRFMPSLSIILAAAISIVLFAALGCDAGPTETRDDTFTVGESAKLVVSTENGGIQVDAGPDGEVRVQATLRGVDRIDYEVSQDGDTITVDVQIDQAWWVWRNLGADIAVVAPATTDVDLETSNGGIDLRGIEGFGFLETSNGKIALESVTGDFDGRTSNGAIDVDGLEGTAMLRTSNGRVVLQEVVGEVDVQTSNGAVSFSGNMTAGGSNRLVSSNGDVDVTLQGTPSVNLDAETSNGKVTSQLPITATVTGETRLVGTIGDGEADLHIRTSNGDVTIR